MAATDRPGLGGAFRPRQDRTEGIAGLLSRTQDPAPADPAPAPDHAVEESVPPEAATAESSASSATEPNAAKSTRRPATPARGRRRPSRRDTRSSSTTPTTSKGAASAEDIHRVVPVVLDADVLEQLRAESRRTGQTHGLITLEAIEDHVDALATHWRASEPGAGSRVGLFGRTQQQHRREAPGSQSQLRLASGDADVLDDLVSRWRAPSRSALVNRALQLRFDAGGERFG